MSRLFVVVLLLSVSFWFAGCYGVRFWLLEDIRWVEVCSSQPDLWTCEARSLLGRLIHSQLMGQSALALAVLATLLRGRLGWRLALLAQLGGLASLALFGASLGVFAVVLSALRLVRCGAGCAATPSPAAP